MNFCPTCGTRLTLRSLEADRARSVCPACGFISYDGATALASSLVVCKDRMLLCQRAQQPALGLWAAPGGYVEKGETLREAAARETFEECGIELDARALELYSILSLPRLSEVHVLFRIELSEEPTLRPGPECLSAAFFSERNLPWDTLAYRDLLEERCRTIFRQIRSGTFGIHMLEAYTDGQRAIWAREYTVGPVANSHGNDE